MEKLLDTTFLPNMRPAKKYSLLFSGTTSLRKTYWRSSTATNKLSLMARTTAPRNSFRGPPESCASSPQKVTSRGRLGS